MRPKVVEIRPGITQRWEEPEEPVIVMDDGIPNYSDCLICRYYLMGGYFKHWKCKAFPQGIPLNIWCRDIQHDKPIVGQGNDLVYEKRKLKKKPKTR